jgi:hypothetical protein
MAKSFLVAAALAPLSLAATLPGAAEQDAPQPCHKGHCHGAEQCGGPWKDYREAVEATGPAAGAATGDEACEAVIAQLGEQAKERAPTRCIELHACVPDDVATKPGVEGKCPDTCTGCGVTRPFGKVDEDGVKRTPKQRGDGKWECTVEGDAITRCRCAPCLPPKGQEGSEH